MLSVRKWLRCVCLFSFICGVVVPFFLFLVTNTYDILDPERAPLEVRSDWEGRQYSPRRPLEVGNPEDVLKELQRIVVSVRNELRTLEHERNRLKRDVDQSKSTLSKVRKEVNIAKSSLQESKGKLAKSLRESKKVLRADNTASPTAKSNIVVVNLPAESAVERGKAPESPQAMAVGEGLECTDQACFDFSKCLLTTAFSVYVYNQHYPELFHLKYPQLVDQLVDSLQLKHSLVEDPDSACIFVAVVGPLQGELDEASMKQKLESLSHWRGSGRNHVIVDLPYSKEPQTGYLRPLGLQAIVAKGSAASEEGKDYNILLPPVTRHGGGSSSPFWKSIRPLLPALRQYLVVHEGSLWDYKEGSEGVGWIGAHHLSSWKDALAANSKDKVLIAVKCNGTVSQPDMAGGGDHRIRKLGEWRLCGSPAQRAALLSNATFSLVIGSRSGTAGPETYTRLIEGLRYGAIPVILGLKHLPFDSIINWKRAAVILPSSVFGKLHLILRNIPQDAILGYRRQGRFLWDTYFSSPLQILDTVVAIVRRRALHPPPPASPYLPTSTLATVPGENHVIPSPEYLYNFTLYSEEFWNSPPGPFYMYPTTPFTPSPVSGSQYVDKKVSSLPQHVIDAGGITGPFFEDYLLGNAPEEQFTIVMLTYERNEVLLAALGRLKDLDHLAKIVVVWNNPNPPPRNMQWPEVGVAIDVVSAGRNSLNNRFLPFSNIHTEAVLSIDDDVHLRHDEIQFAFRVWREARDRVVGFPGRFHAWDTRHSSWLYNSNYTCELSMVLTGAAFLHKYYMFLYSHWLYREARVLVDTYMNCEDIAMNFLVSHITRKPPLKVTSRWTFRCPGCPEALSSSEVHFNERHVCINQLVEMFGYMPLLYTQFRLDSVLFKTRISSHLEKCYEFI